jgi:hypothetical protein
MGIGGILLLVLLVGLIVYYAMSMRPSDGATTLLSGSQSTSVSTTLPYSLPTSMNQPEGIVFSYSMWMLIKDFTTGYGQQRVVLTKGDCPGIYIDSTSNSLIVKIKTYGSTESVLISNLPAMKWIHLAVVVNQQAVDVYINGTLRQHHTLHQLPDQNSDSVKIGSGWNGVVGNIKYYPRTLRYEEVRVQSQETPPPDMQPKVGISNYLDMTWYTGRLNSE